MITYEVAATVAPELRARYEVYMRERHIPDVLATGLFTGARFARSDEGSYRVRYELAGRAALEKYLQVHAPRLRADFAAHFPHGVELSRDSWLTLQQWPH
jgi:hypothetical protein